MKYLKKFRDSDEWKEIDYDLALRTVLSTYNDNEEVRSMLTIGNYIPCRFSEIRIFDDEGLTAMPGAMCLIP